MYWLSITLSVLAILLNFASVGLCVVTLRRLKKSRVTGA